MRQVHSTHRSVATANFELALSITPQCVQGLPATKATQLRYCNRAVIYILCKTLVKRIPRGEEYAQRRGSAKRLPPVQTVQRVAPMPLRSVCFR